MTYKTEGIIIKKSNYKEADLLLRVFTPHFGKITVIAKGARKIKSKLAGNLEMFCHNQFMFAEGKIFDVVCSVDAKERHLFLRENLNKLSQAYYLAELVDKLLPEGEPNPKLYGEFLKAINFILIDRILAVRAFEIKTFRILGFGPEVDLCVNCHTGLEKNHCSLSYNFGGVLCNSCAGKDISAYPVSDNSIKLFRMIIAFDNEVIMRVSQLDSLLSEIKTFNEKYIDKILQRSLKSRNFISKLATM